MGVEFVAGQFELDGTVVSAEAYGNGHINDTYLVRTKSAGGEGRYILQRINTLIFEKPGELMENIIGVTGHLRKKIEAAGGDADRETLTVIPTKAHQDYYVDPEGGCYRVYRYIADTQSLDAAQTPEVFGAAGEAFGRFGCMLSDYPAHTLHETIPDFHDTAKRYRRFLEVAEADPLHRAQKVRREIDFIREREREMPVLLDMLREGAFQLRVTHNDTKLNNILMDTQTGKGLCIIDLDTVMPGTVLWDFGDSIRFGANTADEDERDLSLVGLDLKMFESFVRGYIAGFQGMLTQTETDSFPMGAKMMTMECGMRFLTDYLEGDVYFKTHREGHNLDRCRAQLALVEDMESKWEQMRRIIEQETGK